MLTFLKKLLRAWASEEPAAGESPRRSEERFEQLVAGVRDYAIFLLDRQGIIRSWNAGAERIKGYRAEEILGQSFARFYPPEAADRPARHLRVAAETGRVEDEGWRIRKDGSRFWASIVITALRDPSGELRGFLKITRDLTDRKQAEETARRLFQEEAARQAAEAAAHEAQRTQHEERRQREQWRVTLSSIGDAVIVTDTHGHITFLNPVAEELTGWPAREAVGQPLENVFRIVNEETRQPVEDPVSRVLREGVTVGLANHTVLLARDGREVPIDDSGAPIRGEEGIISGVVLVFRDVTEARRAIEARLYLGAIVESSDDAILGMNLDGVIVSWNKAAERLYGYRAEEIIGKPLSLLVSPDHPDELPNLLERLKRGERIEHFETVRVRKDGGRLDVSLTFSPIKNAEGRIIGISKTARDITERKRNEAGLRFLAEASKLLAELSDVPSTLQKVAGVAVPHFADRCAVDVLEADGSLRRVAVAHVDPAKVALAHELQRRYPPDPQAPHGAWNVLRTGRTEMLSEITDSFLQESVADPERIALVRELGLRSYLGVPGQGIALDGSNNIYVTGYTTSTDFYTKNAWQNANAGGKDAFVAEIAAGGQNVLFSTYLGGKGDEEGNAIAVDPTTGHNIDVAGFTTSSSKGGFTGGPGEVNQWPEGSLGGSDAFVAQLNNSGEVNTIAVLGGGADDSATGVDVDQQGNAYVTGWTYAPADNKSYFPTTAGAFQTSNAGKEDAFVAKVSWAAPGKAPTLTYSTILGVTDDARVGNVFLEHWLRLCEW
jgi:PAS domain S-box-containing protein